MKFCHACRHAQPARKPGFERWNCDRPRPRRDDPVVGPVPIARSCQAERGAGLLDRVMAWVDREPGFCGRDARYFTPREVADD